MNHVSVSPTDGNGPTQLFILSLVSLFRTRLVVLTSRGTRRKLAALDVKCMKQLHIQLTSQLYIYALFQD